MADFPHPTIEGATKEQVSELVTALVMLCSIVEIGSVDIKSQEKFNILMVCSMKAKLENIAFRLVY